ncbi:MAG: hypothetical protein GWP14_08060 [Actinobacteria bacterium]|nr:hypothetical protein [Actinomycetota bacterium]
MSLIQILGLIAAIPLGLGVGFCVMQSWTSLVLAIINLIGFVRGKRERSYTALAFVVAIAQAVFFSGILFGFYYLLQNTFLAHAYSGLAQILLLVFLGIQAIYMLFQVPRKLRIFWLNANYDKSKLIEMEIRNSEKIIITR